MATGDCTTAWVRLRALNTAQTAGPAAAAAGTPRQVKGPDLSALVALAQWIKDESVPASGPVRKSTGANMPQPGSRAGHKGRSPALHGVRGAADPSRGPASRTPKDTHPDVRVSDLRTAGIRTRQDALASARIF
ncbi:hypothetical protein GZL_07645 [Streptomyces sp. 769]|nr:hypothetical protein GZL_07645 [Streptomyces sp. 769]